MRCVWEVSVFALQYSNNVFFEKKCMFAVLFQINKYYYLKNSHIKGQMDVFENTNVMIKHNDK